MKFARGTPARRPRVPRVFFLLWLPVMLLAAACGRLDPPADLVIINGAEPETLDPAILTGQADGRVALALFEGLTRFNAVDATPEPGLAQRWDISSDGRAYLFHLRPNLVWSTGEPITAHDFVYSWLRVLDPRTGADYANLLFYVEGAEEYHVGRNNDPASVGVRALDEQRLEVRLTEPTPFFLDLCAMQTLAVVPRKAIERFGERWLMNQPVPVSGSYELESWRLNDRIRLRKNPRYWDAANTLSEVIDLLPCVVANTALNLYETGAADIVWDKELVPSDLLDVLMQRPDFHSYDYLGTYFFRFNVTRKPFDDPRVRKALALAVDKRRIVERITRGGEKIAHHYVPPGVAGYTSPEGLGYDPEKARALLAEAGFPGGKGFPRFHYLYNTHRAHQKIAVELQEMWRRELGIEMDLRQVEWKVFMVQQKALEFDLSRSSWIGDYNDPNTFLDMFMSNSGNNRTGWRNAEYDRLLREGNAQPDPARRMQLLQQAESMLVEEVVPIVPLYFYAGLEYFDATRIEGVHFNIRAEHPLRVIRRKPAPDRAASAGATIASQPAAL